MALIKRGSGPALEQLYNQTKKAVFSVCYSYLKNYPLAEDLSQDTYVCVKKYIGHYRDDTKPLAWILTIAKNLCLNEIKKRGREVFVDFSERPDLIPDCTELKIKDETGIIRLAKKILDGNEFKIVMMHAVGCVRLKEIAELLASPEGTVRWQYNNALKKLKKNNRQGGLQG